MFHKGYLCVCLLLQLISSSEAGVWSSWGEWGPCSRSCGSGVTAQIRSCLSGNCSGTSHQYRSCGLQACPLQAPSFRAIQCSRRNTATDIWVPVTETMVHKSCQLFCKSVSRKNVNLIASADDGTRCTSGNGKEGICLESMCAPTGCDGVLGSTKEIDKCQQCLGDGTNMLCKRHLVVLNHTSSTWLTIPINATTIKINFTSYIVLSSMSEMRNISVAMEFTLGGAHFLPRSTKRIFATGPLPQIIQIRGDGASQPFSSYEYYQLVEDKEPTERSHYNSSYNISSSLFSWQYNSFSHCSVTCATGFETAHAHCTDNDFPYRAFPDSFCQTASKPLPIVRKCRMGACPPRWVVGQWSSCSLSCGGGTQTRQVVCKQVQEDGTDMVKALCGLATRPVTTRACNNNPCDARWMVGKWSKCSLDCGIGIWTRNVKCVDSRGMLVDRTSCDPTREPVSSQPCNMGPCTYSWHILKWGKCSTTCGTGKRQRVAQCRTHTLRLVDKKHCKNKPQPLTKEKCSDYSGCAKWSVTHWSTCQGECCKEQYQHRKAFCIAVVNNKPQRIADSFCFNATKPVTWRRCNRTDCPQWEEGQWSNCSVTCGSGEKSRLVRCRLGGQEVTGCCENNQPPIVMPCNRTRCPPANSCRDFSDQCRQLATARLCNTTGNYFRQICCSSCQQFLP